MIQVLRPDWSSPSDIKSNIGGKYLHARTFYRTLSNSVGRLSNSVGRPSVVSANFIRQKLNHVGQQKSHKAPFTRCDFCIYLLTMLRHQHCRTLVTNVIKCSRMFKRAHISMDVHVHECCSTKVASCRLTTVSNTSTTST